MSLPYQPLQHDDQLHRPPPDRAGGVFCDCGTIVNPYTQPLHFVDGRVACRECAEKRQIAWENEVPYSSEEWFETPV